MQILSPLTCAELTVLEDRSRPDGRRIQLLVARVDPPGGTTTPDPIMVVGATRRRGSKTAAQPSWVNAPIALPTWSISADRHSVPNIDCPEVDAASDTLVGLRQQDPVYGIAFLKAVQACHDRLTGQGIDLASYDLAASAADIEDLRIALQSPAWNVVANGSATRLAVEVARRFSDHVRALVLTSPLLPGADPFSGAAASTGAAIADIAARCAADAACHAKMPELGASIDQAMAELDAIRLP